MAASSDELVKQELIDFVGHDLGSKYLRVFPESSNDDQVLFSKGGLTFGFDNLEYGSCDGVYVVEEEWVCPLTGDKIQEKPIIAIEGTDALNRKSSGNAQYQRFHHALGALKCGIIAIYYLRKGIHEIQDDLYEMAYLASKKHNGYYLIVQDLNVIKHILEIYDDKQKLTAYLDNYLEEMHDNFKCKFRIEYKNDWNVFAKKRSTIIKEDYIIKYSGRNKRNFTDGSQRAGHIATGEMFLTKYFFPKYKFFYLFLKTFDSELKELDNSKSSDKEWQLLRNEPNVQIVTLDDFENVPKDIYEKLYNIKDLPLKGDALKIFNECKKILHKLLDDNIIKLKSDVYKRL